MLGQLWKPTFLKFITRQPTGDSHPSLINFSPRMSSHNSHLIAVSYYIHFREYLSFRHRLIPETDNGIERENKKKKKSNTSKGEKSPFSRRNKVLSRNKELLNRALMLTDNPLSRIVTCVSNRDALLQRYASHNPNVSRVL